MRGQWKEVRLLELSVRNPEMIDGESEVLGIDAMVQIQGLQFEMIGSWNQR